MDVGEYIKARRTAQNLTLAELSAKSGVSRGMLCDVEANKKNPTIRILAQIAHGLGCSLSDLLESEPSAVFEPLRAERQQTLVEPESGIERRMVAPALVRRGITVARYTVPVGAAIDFPPEQPGVLEHMTVTHGVLRLVSGHEEIELRRGDSVTYEADRYHSLANPGEEPTEFILVMDATQSRRAGG